MDPISRSAVLSECSRYRYRLDRELSLLPTGIVIAYFGINPSTADSGVEDATTKKWNVFSRQLQARSYIVGNVYAYRATDVRKLDLAEDPIGKLNDMFITQIIKDADLLVPCWGDRGKLPKRLRPNIDALAMRLSRSRKPVKVFGLTKSRDPMHPLMLPYSTELMDWMPFCP